MTSAMASTSAFVSLRMRIVSCMGPDSSYGIPTRQGGHHGWTKIDKGGDAGFLMQFGESFVPMNLGDSGVMYVYRDAAFWQCH